MMKHELDELGFRVMCQTIANQIATEHPGVLWLELKRDNPTRWWRIQIGSIALALVSCAAIVWAVYRFVPA